MLLAQPNWLLFRWSLFLKFHFRHCGSSRASWRPTPIIIIFEKHSYNIMFSTEFQYMFPAEAKSHPWRIRLHLFEWESTGHILIFKRRHVLVSKSRFTSGIYNTQYIFWTMVGWPDVSVWKETKNLVAILLNVFGMELGNMNSLDWDMHFRYK